MATSINPYKDIHKGIRKLLIDLLQQAGATVPQDEDQVRQLHQQFVRVQDLLDIHREIEDAALAPVINAAGGAEQLSRIEQDHSDLHQELDDLEQQLKAMLENQADTEQGLRFYLDLSRHVAGQLQHMATEEQLIWPLLSHHCHDQQMLEVQAKARQLTPPAAMQVLIKAMIPAINATEREIVLGNMKKGLSEEAFKGVCALSSSVLTDGEWRSLQLHLESA